MLIIFWPPGPSGPPGVASFPNSATVAITGPDQATLSGTGPQRAALTESVA